MEWRKNFASGRRVHLELVSKRTKAERKTKKRFYYVIYTEHLGTTYAYFGHGLVASSDVDQRVGLEHVVDLVAGVFIESAHFKAMGKFEAFRVNENAKRLLLRNCSSSSSLSYQGKN